MLAVGVDGDVGVEPEPEVGFLLLLRRSQPADKTDASASAETSVDFMFFLIVTYDFLLYGVRRRLFHYPYGVYGLGRY